MSKVRTTFTGNLSAMFSLHPFPYLFLGIRYCDHWKFVTQRLCFIASLLIYLETSSLATRDQVADLLGLAKKGDAFSKTFHLDLEDYLHGLLQLVSELSR